MFVNNFNKTIPVYQFTVTRWLIKRIKSQFKKENEFENKKVGKVY